MSEPCITLLSEDLLSRWGFNDGDDPEEWLDYCEARGIDYNEIDYPLVDLVRRYLLPVIEQAVTVVEIETIHNPIRVEMVDGVDVSEVSYGRAPEPTLTPEGVDVPMAEVLRLTRELAA
ncbi:hypothetical protein DMA15_03625 [Streptomyces sp. WAC 01529]|uniref:hypothetical protein n=1 Tax=Streptomyces sp. WAC 01529 TaxID=2203205 RepID=UPI000F714663|nr:hypothetical protein [Streptomyces sp. WAC 01529]AZM51783.1 hypothetical protein DMA15_03625 [Streptomyces sp. WAC 01529]